jgi:hypothetical protein
MTKQEFLQFIEDNVPDGMEILIEGEDGILLPMCLTDSKTEPHEVYGEVFVIAPCYCDIEDEDYDHRIELSPEDVDIIIRAEMSQPNPDAN